ncbi:hypothetical protein DFH11DRAFT_1748538 [Phellopilus nigrolimitatus]|nr:hypothetical protein DFH11DRAFT_1748538 [Phellopilus nigrolimitatus]
MSTMSVISSTSCVEEREPFLFFGGKHPQKRNSAKTGSTRKEGSVIHMKEDPEENVRTCIQAQQSAKSTRVGEDEDRPSYFREIILVYRDMVDAVFSEPRGPGGGTFVHFKLRDRQRDPRVLGGLFAHATAMFQSDSCLANTRSAQLVRLYIPKLASMSNLLLRLPQRSPTIIPHCSAFTLTGTPENGDRARGRGNGAYVRRDAGSVSEVNIVDMIWVRILLHGCVSWQYRTLIRALRAALANLATLRDHLCSTAPRVHPEARA